MKKSIECGFDYEKKLTVSLVSPATLRVDDEDFELTWGGEGFTVRSPDYEGRVAVNIADVVLEAIRILRIKGEK